MLLKIGLSILLGLIVGDLLCFAIYHLNLIFSDDKPSKKKTRIFRDYMEYLIDQWRINRKRFILYYLFLDVITVSVTVFIVLNYGWGIKSTLAMLFCYGLIVLTYVDIKTQYLPDIITKPLIIIGFVQGYFEIFSTLRESVIGTIAGFGVLWAINTGFRLVRHKDGMGGGDFKLMAAIGAWVGYAPLVFVMLASSIIGIFVAVGLSKFADNKLSAPSPFGPSLAIAGVVALFWWEAIIGWYLGLLY